MRHDYSADAKRRHDIAWKVPATSYERAIRTMIDGLELYGRAHQAEYGTPIGEDSWACDSWRDMALCIIHLLSGERGRLDGGLTDAYIRHIAKVNAVDLEG